MSENSHKTSGLWAFEGLCDGLGLAAILIGLAVSLSMCSRCETEKERWEIEKRTKDTTPGA